MKNTAIEFAARYSVWTNGYPESAADTLDRHLEDENSRQQYFTDAQMALDNWTTMHRQGFTDDQRYVIERIAEIAGKLSPTNTS